MLLTIAIPTFNRCNMLAKNVTELSMMIKNNDLINDVEILVSDNCSTDQTLSLIENIKNTFLDVSIRVFTNTENMGLTKNVLKALKESAGEYVMFLGDDDYISESYLMHILNLIQKGYGCIIPSYKNITLSGEETGRGRDLNCCSKSYKNGFFNCFMNSWRGHQLSGLVMLKKNLYAQCIKENINNLYTQIFMISYCCLHYETYHLTDYPVLVTRPPQQSKNWGYGDDGLLTDVFDNYGKLKLTSLQRFLLEIKFLYAQYWRCAMYLKKGPIAFFKCLWKLMKSPKITMINRILLIFEIPFIFLFQALRLLLSGNLLKTLKTKVDA